MGKYRPTIIVSGSKGYSGPASLEWTESKVTINFDEVTNRDGKVIQEEATFKFPVDELPDYCQDWNLSRAHVTLKPKNKEVLGMRPLNKVLTVKFIKYAAKDENTPPAPIAKNGMYGEYHGFTPIMEVCRGPFEGAVIPGWLIYDKFSESETGEVAIAGTKEASQKLLDFLDASGAWDQGAIKWRDNLLPTLEKRQLAADREFQIVLKNGQIESYMPSDGFEGDEDEEEKPRRKSSKDEDEDEAPRKSKRDEDEEDAPKSKKRPVDDEDAPKKKHASEDDEEPRKSKVRHHEDEDIPF